MKIRIFEYLYKKNSRAFLENLNMATIHIYHLVTAARQSAESNNLAITSIFFAKDTSIIPQKSFPY